MKEIFERRSVRAYTSQPVADEDITKLLKAAMQAPSAGNMSPWEFVVIRDKQALADITKVHPYASMLHEAACAIVICGDTTRRKFPQDFWVLDCAAAAQNMLLEATHLGLGAVWLAVYPLLERMEGIQAQFGIPARVVPLTVISLGHPVGPSEPVDKYHEEYVHWDKW